SEGVLQSSQLPSGFGIHQGNMALVPAPGREPRVRGEGNGAAGSGMAGPFGPVANSPPLPVSVEQPLPVGTEVGRWPVRVGQELLLELPVAGPPDLQSEARMGTGGDPGAVGAHSDGAAVCVRLQVNNLLGAAALPHVGTIEVTCREDLPIRAL